MATPRGGAPDEDDRLVEAIAADAERRGYDPAGMLAHTWMILVGRMVRSCRRERDDASSEVRSRARTVARARAELDAAAARFAGAAGMADPLRPWTRRLEEAHDRLARASRRLERARRELDTWEGEALSSAAELAPRLGSAKR